VNNKRRVPRERQEGRARQDKYQRFSRTPPPTLPPTHTPPQHSITRSPPRCDTMTTAAQGDPPPVDPPPAPLLLLGPVLGILPAHLFQQEVLRRLGPGALASLAGAGRGCAAAVAATALMQWVKRAKRTRPFPLPPLCLKAACSYAAHGGNREVLEWLHNTGCPWNAETASAAARGGHLEVLRWAWERGCPWDWWTCAHAARFGHLRVLQWAREHHCPWNSLTPGWAAAGGHLMLLQWARDQGCPWNSYACEWAAKGGHVEVLQWMRENDVTGEFFAADRVRRHAGGPRKQEVLTWLDGLSAL